MTFSTRRLVMCGFVFCVVAGLQTQRSSRADEEEDRIVGTIRELLYNPDRDPEALRKAYEPTNIALLTKYPDLIWSCPFNEYVLKMHEKGLFQASDLQVAAMMGDAERVRAVLKKMQARPYSEVGDFSPIEGNAGLPGDYTPLRLAIRRGHPNVVRVLIEAKANVNQHAWRSTPYSRDRYPLSEAIMHGEAECVRLLIEAGADLQALHESYEPLVSNDPRVSLQNLHEIRCSPLVKREAKYQELVKVGLMRAEPYPEANVACPLLLAINEGDSKIVSLLLDAGADPNVFIGRDTNEASARPERLTIGDHRPLHIAASKGNVEIVRLLIKKGADVNAATSDGQSALSRARRHNHNDIARLLLEAGAK